MVQLVLSAQNMGRRNKIRKGTRLAKRKIEINKKRSQRIRRKLGFRGKVGYVLGVVGAAVGGVVAHGMGAVIGGASGFILGSIIELPRLRRLRRVNQNIEINLIDER